MNGKHPIPGKLLCVTCIQTTRISDMGGHGVRSMLQIVRAKLPIQAQGTGGNVAMEAKLMGIVE